MSWRRYRIYCFWIAVINIIARMWTHCSRIWSIHPVDKIFSVCLDNFKHTTRICSIGTIIHLRITLGKINSLGNCTKFETVGKIIVSIRVFFGILWIAKNQEIIFSELKRAEKILGTCCYSSSYLRLDNLHNPYCFLDLGLGIFYFLDHISNLV